MGMERGTYDGGGDGDTPCSSSTSPASSASPPTPQASRTTRLKSLDPDSALHHQHHNMHGAGEREKPPVDHPLKGKMFAYAIPSVW